MPESLKYTEPALVALEILRGIPSVSLWRYKGVPQVPEVPPGLQIGHLVIMPNLLGNIPTETWSLISSGYARGDLALEEVELLASRVIPHCQDLK